MNDRQRTRIAAALTATAVFGMYLATMAPGLTVFESGELAAAAWSFGIPFPTGFPVWVLLAGAWARIPLGPVIWRTNVFSALCMAAAVYVVALLAAGIAAGVARRASVAEGGDAAGRAFGLAASQLPAWAAVFGGLTFGLSRTAWSTALTTNVWTLQILLISLVLLLAVRLHDDPDSGAHRSRSRWIALLFGSALAGHVSAVVLVPPLAVLLVRRPIDGRRILRSVLRTAPFLLAGMLPLLFIPFRSAMHPAIDWGHPAALRSFIEHVTAWQLRDGIGGAIAAIPIQTRALAVDAPGQFGILLLPLMLAGLVVSFRPDARVAWALLLLAAASLLYGLTAVVYTPGIFVLPAYAVAALWAVFGFAAWACSRHVTVRIAAYVIGLAGIGLAATASYPQVTQRDNTVADAYARTLLLSLPPGSVLFSDEWHLLISPAEYLQTVEGLRPDVAVVDVRLLSRPWYLARLQQSHPGLLAGCRGPIARLHAALDARVGGVIDAAEVDSSVSEIRRTLAVSQSVLRPVCSTPALKALAPGLDPLPDGLAYRQIPTDGAAAAACAGADFELRPPARVDDMIRSIEDRYFRMHAERGYCLYARGLKTEADTCFARAVRYRPFSSPGRRWKDWMALSAHSRKLF